MSETRAPERALLRKGFKTAATIAGGLLLAGALAADQAWWDRHFLPLFFYSREKFLLTENLARLGVAIAGLGLIAFGRKAIDHLARRMSATGERHPVEVSLCSTHTALM